MPSTKTTKTSTNTTAAATPHSPPLAPSAAEVAENFDILTEILLRLPIKSLIKFKSVSKQWLSIISDPKFSLRRSSSPASATALLLERFPEYLQSDFIHLNKPSPRLSTPFSRSPTFAADRLSGIKIMQSCNGLLLCFDTFYESSSDAYCSERTETGFYVYNPTTNQRTTLPRPAAAKSARVWGFALAFDPSRSPHYKVVCVRNWTLDPTQYCFEIFSSDAGQVWRPSALGPFEASFDTLWCRGVFWCGGVHWISWSGTSLRFHVDGEQLRQVPSPPVPGHLVHVFWKYRYFGESRGHLHFVDYLNEPGESRINVYEMERDCSGWFVKYTGWFVKYTVDLSELLVEFPEILNFDSADKPYPEIYRLSVLCVVRGEVEEDSFLVMSIPGKILRYDFKNRAFCKLCDVPIEDVSEVVLETFFAYQYIESLACV